MTTTIWTNATSFEKRLLMGNHTMYKIDLLYGQHVLVMVPSGLRCLLSGVIHGQDNDCALVVSTNPTADMAGPHSYVVIHSLYY